MIASTHLAVGAAAGILVQALLPSESGMVGRSITAFAAGFASHIFIDAIPHQEYTVEGAKLFTILIVEVSAMLFLLLSPIDRRTNTIVLLAMAGGAVPDLIGMSYKYIVAWPWLEGVGAFIHYFHGKIPLPFQVSYLVQLFVAMFAVIVVQIKSAF